MNDEEIIANLEMAKNGDIPSPFGRASFTIYGAPSSVQSKEIKKCAYIEKIKNELKPLKYILTGEIILNITWLNSAKSRFETDAKADIDNCIKPIIDAFTGVDGLFIDDCQLSGLYICWRHIESQDERVVFDFEFHPDEFIQKNELAFIKLDGGLCTPVSLNLPVPARVIWKEMLIQRQKSKGELENLGVSYLMVAGFLGNSRPFHITRTKGFKKLSLDEFIKHT